MTVEPGLIQIMLANSAPRIPATPVDLWNISICLDSACRPGSKEVTLKPWSFSFCTALSFSPYGQKTVPTSTQLCTIFMPELCPKLDRVWWRFIVRCSSNMHQTCSKWANLHASKLTSLKRLDWKIAGAVTRKKLCRSSNTHNQLIVSE